MAFWGQTTEKHRFPETELAHPLKREQSENKEFFIAPGVIIEGKIKGTGNVRIAGCFKGEIHAKGNVTVEPKAHIIGCIWAQNIVVRGEIEGDIHATSRVGLLDFGVLNGNLRTSLLTVATGSRMRGKVELGWDEKEADKVVPIESAKFGV
jgi:cytoskeletal protein CcmA (bactofilin family)